MRILHVTATHMNKLGGVPSVLINLIKEQNKIQDVQSMLLSIKADVGSFNDSNLIHLEKKQCDSFLDSYQPDFVIIHSFYCIDYIWFYRILLKKKIKYLIEPHGAFVKEALRDKFSKKCIANSTIFKGLIRNAYGYIYLSNEEAENSKYNKENDIVIPNGILPFKRDFSLKPNNSLYFIGRFDIHEKGIDLLFDALDILDSKKNIYLSFYFIGSGSKPEIQYVDRRIKNYKYIKVFNVGPLYDNEKYNFIEKMNIMVLPSLHEGFPMTVLEALQCGNPCIVTPGTNVKDLVVNHSVGWCCDCNAIELAKMIPQALNEYNKTSNDYIQRCSELVNTYYTWNEIALESIKKLKSIDN